MSRLLVAVVAAFALVLPAAAGAATWDTTALDLSPAYTGSVNAVGVAPTDDGAVWVAWAVDPSGAGGNVSVFARRVSADGVPGQIRTLTTGGAPTNSASVSLVAVPGGDVRVSYLGAASKVLAVRRLTPTATGPESVLYDAATTDDGDIGQNEQVLAQRLLPAPGGATWALFERYNGPFSTSPVAEARQISAGDTVGPLARPSGAYEIYESAGAVDGSGRLIVAMVTATQAHVMANSVAPNGSVGTLADVLPVSGPGTGAQSPAIGIDAAGIATVGWHLFSPGSNIAEVGRLDTTTTPMTTGGAPVTPLDEGLAAGFVQYGPLLAVDPGGSAIAAWTETDSNTTSNDVIARGLAAGSLSAPGAIGPRRQLDGPPPEGGSPAAALPGPNGISTVFSYAFSGSVATCTAARLTTAGGLAGIDTLPSGCRVPTAPASASNGLAATWATNSPYVVQLARLVDAAPSCSDGAPVSVEVGTTTTLSLTCSGWRAQRAIAGAPARGTLGAIDQAAGTVTYTAGGTPGADSLTFRASNAAGDSATRTVPITVQAAPVTPAPAGGGTPPPAATPDRTSPVVSTLRVAPSKLKLTRLRAPTATWKLSEAATVTVTVERLRQGRRVRGRCLPAKKKAPKRTACTKATQVSQLTRAVPAGAARLTIAVRSGKRTLPAGSYRVTVKAVDPAGNRSTPATARFTIAF